MYWLCLRDNVVVIGLPPLGVNPPAASKDTRQCHSQLSRLDSQGTQTQDQLFLYVHHVYKSYYLSGEYIINTIYPNKKTLSINCALKTWKHPSSSVQGDDQATHPGF